MMCDYCNKHYKSGVAVTWDERNKNEYCNRCWPEVLDNVKRLPWFSGYTLQPIGDDKQA